MSQIKHVAIIMDGNGRWAKQRIRPRIWGHVRGSSVVADIVQAAGDEGLKALTLYAFSTENWSRPFEEVSTLFKLLKKFLKKEKAKILANNIKFRVIGDIENLPPETISLIKEIEELTNNSTGLQLTFAFGYGGRSEIIRAFNSFTSLNPGKKITEVDMNGLMYRPESGDVDLMIRTGGEQRISNFLLWQMAYAELYFTPTKWPEFTSAEFKQILMNVSTRERRFGNIGAQSGLIDIQEESEETKSRFLKESLPDV
jgi:undecaprenyl diphosphate synthase